jgi:hypothetical protein
LLLKRHSGASCVEVTLKDKMALLPLVAADLQAEFPTMLFWPVHSEALRVSYPTMLLYPLDPC